MIDWRPITERLGFTSEEAMWSDLYDKQKLSIAALAQRLGVSRNTIRTTLTRRGVHIRKRGGPNNVALELTEETVAEIRRDGVMVVAKRMGLSYTTLYKRLRRIGVSVADLRKEEA